MKEIRKKLHSILPMRGTERKAFACVLLSIISGIILSLSLHNWSWLNGSGAIIIIIGIWFTWKDFSKIASNYGKSKQEELIQLISQHEHNKPEGLISGAMHDGEVESLKKIEQDIKELTILMVKRLRIIEVSLLMTGTFISSYGNLFLDLIKPFK